MFCGDVALQVGTELVDLPSLTKFSGLVEALAALGTAIAQGEDGDSAEDSHFARFVAIRAELTQMLASSDTSSAWPAARNH